jgi:hypothetical protein
MTELDRMQGTQVGQPSDKLKERMLFCTSAYHIIKRK